MKRITALLIASVLFQFCSQERVSPPSLQKVQFGFTKASLPGGKMLSSLAPGTSITISIEKATGESVLSFQKIELLQFGDEFISAPVSLVAGDYRVTDFLIVNDSSQILFATPKEGSEFAGLVNNPLPVSFSVVAGQANSITMEVVDASGKTPLQLGYVSFGLSFVYPLTLTVDGIDHGSSTPISADIYVLHESDTVQHFSVVDGFGTFGFTGDPTKNYSVHAIASGYFRSIYPLNYSSIKANNASTLSMVLPPALTINGFVDNLYDTNAF